MPTPFRTLVACALLAGSLAASARADDAIILKNGNEIRGRILSEDDKQVRIDIGGGSMWFQRSQIAEVRREKPVLPDKPEEPVAPQAGLSAGRDEHALVYTEGERTGVRVFRARREPDGYVFEEERVELDAKGVPVREVRTIERADLQYRPVSFQVRETGTGDAKPLHRTTAGEFRAGRLHLTVTTDGEREKSDQAAPGEPRLPYGAREMFLRESRALAGRLEARVYDPLARSWAPVVYQEGGLKRVRVGEQAGEVRVVLRRRGETVEQEWVRPDLTTLLVEMDGNRVRALAADEKAVARVRTGDSERSTGGDSAARTRYADKELGWRIDKPDPSWTFEKPGSRASGALLVVRNEAVYATVDVMLDPATRADVTPERAAEAVQRALRAVAPDFQVEKDGWIERGGLRVYWFVAKATTKGEATRTLGRVVVKEGVVFRLLAACPAAGFEVLRPEFEKILDSFVVE